MKNKAKSDLEKVLKEISPYMNLGLQMIIPIGMGAVAGWYLDKRFDTNPLCILILSMFGIVVGFYIFFRTVMKTKKK